MRRVHVRLRGERGATLVLVAVSMVTLLAGMALAIDLGMLFSARTEAQRVADAAALAGASAFVDQGGLPGVPGARNRAVEYVGLNTLRREPIDTMGSTITNTAGGGLSDQMAEVRVDVMPTDESVRVTIRRAAIGTWFARIFGRNAMPVSATAVARAFPAGSARCIKPFAMPDIWHDANGDLDGDRVWDTDDEVWRFGDDPGDYYKKYTGGDDNTETGYGGHYRDDYHMDYGRQLKLKVTDPNDVEQAQSGQFFPWQLPAEEFVAECRIQPGPNENGAKTYMANICNCNTSPIELGVPYQIKTGNMVGPTAKGVGELIDMDKNAYWHEFFKDGKLTGEIRYNGQSDYADNPMSSPRVIKVAMYDASQINKPGMTEIVFNNFGLFFIEEQKNQKEPIVGRFLTYVSGNDEPGQTTGPLVKILRLVE